jgi:hypothetical protein
LKTRSDIDWSNPRQPAVFGKAQLRGQPAEPGHIGDGMFVLVGSQTARWHPMIGLTTLIYYVRKACLTYPAFREELEEMLSLLPARPVEPTDGGR